MSWTVQRLTRQHVRDQFDCGQPVLNDWLKQRASQFDRRDLSRTFVATDGESPAICGYYALSSHRVVGQLVPEPESSKLPKLDVPVVLLGKLAVDRTMQGRGLGAFLLIDALRRAELISHEIGVRAVEVDALDDAARKFYLKFGFRSLLDDPLHLFLPMHEIRQLRLTE